MRQRSSCMSRPPCSSRTCKRDRDLASRVDAHQLHEEDENRRSSVFIVCDLPGKHGWLSARSLVFLGDEGDNSKQKGERDPAEDDADPDECKKAGQTIIKTEHGDAPCLLLLCYSSIIMFQ